MDATSGVQWASQRERDVAQQVGFRVKMGRVELLSAEGDRVRSVQPATTQVQTLWHALMTPESDWGNHLRAVS